jgi:hypothetical protein
MPVARRFQTRGGGSGPGATAPPQRNRRWLGSRPNTVVSLPLLAGLGFLLAACGGGSSNAVASLGHKTSTTADAGATVTTLPPGASVQKQYQEELQFSQCMRSHGITNFPDPSSTGGIKISVNPGNPQLASAQKACQKYLPPGPTRAQQEQNEQQALAFAACMRAHGLPNFPDPTFGPNGAINRNYGPGNANPGNVNPNSPAFQDAAKKCNP